MDNYDSEYGFRLFVNIFNMVFQSDKERSKTKMEKEKHLASYKVESYLAQFIQN